MNAPTEADLREWEEAKGAFGVAAAEIRRLRASLAERDELPARAGEVLDAFSIVEIDRKEHIRAVDGSSYVIFNEGEFFGVDIFFAIGRRAASLASEIKEKQP